MTNKEYIRLFIDRTLEKTYDELILGDKDYILPKEKILAYIHRVLSIPYIEFIDYVASLPAVCISEKQLTQSSTFAAYTEDMCEALRWYGNPGMRFVDIGQLFPQFVKNHNDVAYRKYGENQIKTSAQLGLAFDYYDYWYLTCVGYVYNDLPHDEKFSLLARTLLRDPLYRDMLLRLLKEDVNMMDYMKSLSDSTIGRRSGSILKLIRICLDECFNEDIVVHTLYQPTYCSKTKTIRMKEIPGTFIESPIQRIYAHRAANFVPLYSIHAACGYFEEGVVPEQEAWVDISGLGIKPDAEKLFVVYAKGQSMTPKIKEGDLCIFEWTDEIPEDGSIVLTQCSSVDNEYGGEYTIKKLYASREWEDGVCYCSEIRLCPINTAEYQSITLVPDSDNQYRTIGVLKGVIPMDA